MRRKKLPTRWKTSRRVNEGNEIDEQFGGEARRHGVEAITYTGEARRDGSETEFGGVGQCDNEALQDEGEARDDEEAPEAISDDDYEVLGDDDDDYDGVREECLEEHFPEAVLNEDEDSDADNGDHI